MKTVTVKKTDLVEALKSNLEKHTKQLAIIKDERKSEMIEALRKLLDDLAADGEGPENLRFPLPADHRDDYERAIRMAEMSVDDNIELDQQEFNQYVMDNWLWKTDFLRTALAYDKVAGRLQ